VIWAVLFYRWYFNDPLKNPKLNQAERELLQHSALHAEGHGDVPWGRLLASRQVWMLCWQYFCLSYGWYFYITWLPTYLREGRHLTLTTSAWLGVLPLFCGGLGNPAGAYLTGVMARSWGRGQARRVMAYIGFSGAAGFLVLSTRVGDPLMAMICIGLASFSNDLVMPGTWAAAMDVGGKYAGTLSGAMNMWGNFGGLLGPVIIPYILRWTGNSWNDTFYVSAAIYVAGGIFWVFLDPVTPLPTAE
jgi:MFS transporter, ACS family, glucarate transporter